MKRTLMSNNTQTLSEKEKFLNWLEEEKKNGLVDIKFYPGETAKVNMDEFYAEANSINDAKANGHQREIRYL